MSTRKAKLLKSLGDTDESRLWQGWMDSVAELVERYSRLLPSEDRTELNDDPFAYNETASVSILTAAAYDAGHVALAEFSADKASDDEEVAFRNAKTSNAGNGRIDLWMMAKSKSWAFEFKQFSPIGVSEERMQRYLDDASDCASKLLEKAADCSVAGLIWPLWWTAVKKEHDKEKVNRAADKARRFALIGCDYAWSIPGYASAPPTFIMFKIAQDFSTEIIPRMR